MQVTDFSLWIKNERLKRGMTQTEFANFLGTTFATIVNLEKAKTKPRIKTQKAIVKKLKVNFEFLNNLINKGD